MKPPHKCLYLLVLGSLLSPAANAEIYKWTDENGVTHFSEQQPEAEVPVATVDTKYSRATAKRETWQELDAEFAERNEENLKAKAEAAKASAEAAEKKANCEQARRRATSLQRPRINEVLEDGSRVRIGEDKRQAEIKKANEAVAKFCN